MNLPPLPFALDLWLPAWLRRPPDRMSPLGAQHVLLAFGETHEEGCHREDLPAMMQEFRDRGGFPPRHTFFYPAARSDPGTVEKLSELCRATGAEMELWLQHPERPALEAARDLLARHGQLARDETGALRYGLIHGGTADPTLLRETGCYGDFTFPTAPRRSQPRRVNSLYYTRSGTPRPYDKGRPVRAARVPEVPAPDELLVVQGPLTLEWEERRWGVLPAVERGELSALRPPSPRRLQRWLECRIAVQGRPGWVFISLRLGRETTGEALRQFHRDLARRTAEDPSFHYHYVSAREMVNLLHAAEAGHSGDPVPFRDFRYRRGAG